MSTLMMVLIALGMMMFLYNVNPAKPKKSDYQHFGIRPYSSKKPLTPTETHFYHRLVQALPEHIVLAQVQLASFLKVDQSKIGLNEYYRWFNPISQQSVDYLICSKDFTIITAIELDDKSHYSDKAIYRDTKKNNNLKAANVPLIRWHAESMPEIEQIRQKVSELVSPIGQEQTISDSWFDQDEKEAFFSRSKKQNIFNPLTIGGGIFLITVFMLSNQLGNKVGENIFIKLFKIQTNISNSPVAQPSFEYQKMIERQNQERQAREAAKREELLAKQLLTQQQEQAKYEQIHEASLKEEAWKNFDKNRVDCTTENDIVKCGNDYISKRRKFEQAWEDQKTSQR